jgi:hypothetical protein
VPIPVDPRTWSEHRRARREADEWIWLGFESDYPDRAAELTSERERKLCARSLRSVLAELDGSKLPGATPLRSRALRPHAALIAALERRLSDGRPVPALGMLEVNSLLTSPHSCLFHEEDDIETRLRAVLESLEVR